MAIPHGACSHKQVVNVFCMILAFGVIIYEVLKIFHEKWQNLWLIEAILGYEVFPHTQRLKAVHVHFICYFAEGSHSSSGISEFCCSTRSRRWWASSRVLGGVTSSIKSKICL